MLLSLNHPLIVIRNDDEGPSNQILQKALLTHINKKVEVMRGLPTANFSLRKITQHDSDAAKEGSPLLEEEEVSWHWTTSHLHIPWVCLMLNDIQLKLCMLCCSVLKDTSRAAHPRPGADHSVSILH